MKMFITNLNVKWNSSADELYFMLYYLSSKASVFCELTFSYKLLPGL